MPEIFDRILCQTEFGNLFDQTEANADRNAAIR